MGHYCIVIVYIYKKKKKMTSGSYITSHLMTDDKISPANTTPDSSGLVLTRPVYQPAAVHHLSKSNSDIKYYW